MRCAKHKDAPGAKVIVTESVFSMEGDVAPLRQLLDLASQYGADVIVDEAHATGVCGPAGARNRRGTRMRARDPGHRPHLRKGAGKRRAPSCAAGSVLRQFLINRARTFIFSTAIPPYLAGQIRAALVLAQQADTERAHLNEIAALLRGGLAAHGLQAGSSTTHIVPVILGTNESALQVAAHLQANGFAAKAIRPPTVPAGTSRVRISLTSKITAQDIQRIVAAIAGASDSLRPREVPSTVHA